jgi:hypothetical protein
VDCGGDGNAFLGLVQLFPYLREWAGIHGVNTAGIISTPTNFVCVRLNLTGVNHHPKPGQSCQFQREKIIAYQSISSSGAKIAPRYNKCFFTVRVLYTPPAEAPFSRALQKYSAAQHFVLSRA